MPHIRIEPIKELEFLSKRMKNFVENFPESFSFEIGSSFEPFVDVHHDGTNVYVTVELPGVRKEDMTLTLKADTLLVAGLKRAINFETEQTEFRAERKFGDFQRSIPLPCEVDANSISATLADGVLSVVLTKRFAVESNEIKIEVQ